MALRCRICTIQTVKISVPGSVVGAAEPRASSFLGIGLMVLVLARKRFDRDVALQLHQRDRRKRTNPL
jgi:hypothetical protein